MILSAPQERKTAQRTVLAFHEPTHPRPLPGGEQAYVRGAKIPLLGGARGGFMVPMHAPLGSHLCILHLACACTIGVASLHSTFGLRPVREASLLQRQDT